MKRVAVLSLLLAGCTNAPDASTAGTAAAAATPPPPETAAPAGVTLPADAFLANLHALCGQAFAGRIVANEPPSTSPDPFEGKALVMHVRDTLAAAAAEGARYAATVDRGPADGVLRTRTQIDGALAERYAEDVSARTAVVDGLPTVVVRVRAVVPALGLWGPGIEVDVEGHGVEETP